MPLRFLTLNLGRHARTANATQRTPTQLIKTTRSTTKRGFDGKTPAPSMIGQTHIAQTIAKQIIQWRPYYTKSSSVSPMLHAAFKITLKHAITSILPNQPA
ncbi:hypothetical protein [Moraxella caviae]|uniref:hypothetical protein n=1 Tax=Moraxella caviae TaxID=34060 RepID=UPI000E1C1DF1|nr:hypothetical protein [Moraxella caviae]